MKCPNCEFDNPEGAKFCMNCGHELTTLCPNCETALPPGARFCFNCGYELEAGSTVGMEGVTATAVADRLAEEVRAASGPTGERRTITMLFCDVVGSTSAAEQVTPEQWASIMNGAFDRFIEPVERYGGTVARLLGDAILAYFGAPTAHEDDPQRAILAALTMMSSSEDYAEAVKAEFGLDFAVRIGINTGLVVLDELGTDSYREYTALGDAVNMAARMEQSAEPGMILIAEPTYRLVAPLFDVDPVGEIEVKGKAEGVAAYRVLAAKSHPGSLRGIEGLHSPVVGREEEMEKLLAAMAALASGRGQVVSLIGDAGMGKSRLSNELKTGALRMGRDISWVEGRSFSYDTTTPLAPVIDLLEECFEIAPDDDNQTRFQKIVDRERGLLGEESRRDAAILANLLGVELSDQDNELIKHLMPPQVRNRIFEAVHAHFQAMARHNPVVLVFEDLHWADPTSVDLVESLLPLTDETMLMVLTQFRPRRDEPAWRVHETAAREYPHRYTAIELQPLDEGQARVLVANLLRVEGLHDAVREAILDKAEGNPFFVEEVIRSLLDDGTIVAKGDQFIATTEVAEITVPDTLAAVIATRLDGLDPETRRMVQTASVIGRDFSHDLLSRLADPDVVLDAVLTDLMRRELILQTQVNPTRVYTFKHALTMDTAYESLLLSVRQDLHRIVGKLTEEQDPGNVTDLARHFLAAEEHTKALPYLVSAADLMAHAYSMPDAIHQYRQALELFSDVDDPSVARRAYEGLANALVFTGETEDALDTYREMLSFGEERSDVATQVSALNKWGFTIGLMAGEIQEGEKLLGRARGLAEQGNDKAGLAECHTNMCSLNIVQGKLDEAVDHLKDLAAIGTEIESEPDRIVGLAHQALMKTLMLDFEEAEDLAQEALAAAEEAGELVLVAQITGGIIVGLEISRGRLEDALKNAHLGNAIAQEIGAAFVIVYSAAQGAWAAFLLGRFEAASTLANQAIEYGSAMGMAGEVGSSQAILAGVAQAVSGPRAGEAISLMTEAKETLVRPRAGAYSALAYANLSHSALVAGDDDLATACLDLGNSIPSATRNLAKPDLLLCSAQRAINAGDWDRARDLMTTAASFAKENKLRWVQPKAQLALGVLSLVDGDVETADQTIAAAAEDARAMRALPLALEIHRNAAEYLILEGQAELAARHNQQAGEVVAEIASLFEAADLRREYLRTNATG